MTEEVQEAVEEPQDQDAQEPSIEERAAGLGWKSPDEWKGEKPKGYIDDPARFVEWAENLGPVKKMMESQAAELTRIKEEQRRTEAAVLRQVERERAQYQANLKAIQAAKAQAHNTGDIDSYVALDRQESQIRAQAEAPEAPPEAEISAKDREEFDMWVANNSDWFGPNLDKEKSEAAVAAYAEAERRGISTVKGRLAFVDKQIAAKAPPKEPPVARFETALGAGGGGQSAFSKLPKDAKDQFKRFVVKGIFADSDADRKQYAEDYNAA